MDGQRRRAGRHPQVARKRSGLGQDARPIFLGEFGAYQDADMDSRARWTRFVSREATKLGMSWTYREFCSGFEAYDPKAKAWRRPLASALSK